MVKGKASKQLSLQSLLIIKQTYMAECTLIQPLHVLSMLWVKACPLSGLHHPSINATAKSNAQDCDSGHNNNTIVVIQKQMDGSWGGDEDAWLWR